MTPQPSRDESAELRESQKTWFDHMTGYLKWKILGPDINNPFKPPVSYHLLTRMANQREYLAQHIQIRCMCDGYEVMIIANPANPRVTSSHPCISSMPHDLIFDYITRAQLDEFIEEEIDRITEEIKEHLAKRTQERAEYLSQLSAKKRAKTADGLSAIGKDPAKDGNAAKESGPSKGAKDSSKSKGYRVLKR